MGLKLLLVLEKAEPPYGLGLIQLCCLFSLIMAGLRGAGLPRAPGRGAVQAGGAEERGCCRRGVPDPAEAGARATAFLVPWRSISLGIADRAHRPEGGPVGARIGATRREKPLAAPLGNGLRC